MLIIKVQNTTDLAPVSDYRYEVLVNLEVIASGEVKGHVRADGWAELVRRVIEPYLPANSVMVTWIKPEDRLPDDDQAALDLREANAAKASLLGDILTLLTTVARFVREASRAALRMT